MAHSTKFASGKYANAICDVCSMRVKYVDLRETTIRGKRTGILACPVCWDKDHPQNFLSQYITTDAQALRHARPDTGLQASRKLYPSNNWTNGRPTAFRE
ncbi:MAG TPA: hypothetical protein VH157_06925 [Bryobacteraceae bacterium]|jgi:hypothetical protein|nr:hypothetical protein [Bryobacteraceae bacterium]